MAGLGDLLQGGPPPDEPGLGDRLLNQWKASLANRIISAPSKLFGGLVVDPAMDLATLAGDVIHGRQPTMAADPQTGEFHTDPRLADRAMNAAGMLTLGAGAIPAEANSLRMGARVLKQETPFSGIKRDIPIEETTATYAPTPGQELQPVKPFNIANLKEGDYIVPFLGDRSLGEGSLTGVAGQKFRKPVPQEGGSDYLRRPDSPLWASDPKVIGKYEDLIKRLQGEKGKKNSIWGATVAMGPQSLDYSMQTVRTMLQQMKKAPLSEKAKKVFDKRMREEWSDFPGYDWPGLDKVTDKWWRTAGSARTKAMKFMDTAQMRDLGAPDIAAARWANTHPDLRGDIPFLATGHGWTKVGPKGVQSVTDPADWHSTYRAKLFAPESQYAGRSPLMPGEEVFSDWGQGAQGLKDTSQKQRSFTTKEVVQRVTPEVLKTIEKYLKSPAGKKLGIAGAVAAGLLTAEQAEGLFGERAAAPQT